MVIHAHLEDSTEPAGRSREPRRTLLLETQGVTTLGDAAHVLIHNVSATGLLLETEVPLKAGQKLTIDLPQAGATLATVMWQSGRLFGCQFEASITTAVLSAAQLRGATGREIEIAPRHHGSADEGLGLRLQRLRKALGISQGRLAEQLGVSKPTVWAWEQARRGRSTAGSKHWLRPWESHPLPCCPGRRIQPCANFLPHAAIRSPGQWGWGPRKSGS